MSGVDLAVSVIAKLLEYTARPVIQPVNYILHHDTNINTLTTQLSSLENTQSGVQQQVDAANRNGETILPSVQAWLTKANNLTTESENFLTNEAGKSNTCVSGSCPNLKLIYKSSRQAKKITMEVDELVQGGKFDRVSHPARLPPLWSSGSVTELDGFESRKTQLRLMMEALEDDGVNIIGVYGMGGIGKTTFVEEVAKQAYAHQLFDEMVMVVVSHKPNLRKLQGDLAEMLELNLKEEGELLRTVRLRERLNQVKRILIIMDDLWTPLDLATIGIPQGNINKGCKIILTSRSLDVCNAMNTQRNFHMDVLSPVESWNLFKKMAGDSVESSDLNPIAVKVAKICSGLPLAIVTVASALRHKGKHAWRDALCQLRSSTVNDVKGVYANVFATLELSFNFLKDEETKACFLLCSLFKEDLDIPVEYLVRYGIGLRLFQDVYTLEEARDRVHTIVENLKACCLLLDSDVEDCFQMHDVTRDFLLSVACRGVYKFLEKMIPEYLDSSSENKLGNYYAISMVLNNLEEFPIGIDYPKLQLWRLEGSMELVQFSGNKNYFDGMKDVKVVLMHHVSIPSIPPSFLTLRKLITLCLEHCKLGDLSLIKELKRLEILSFMHSDIEKLPKEIRELSRLRLLDLSDCKSLRVIPFGVFSNLYNLECLYMMNSFRQWGFHGQNSQNQATLDELKNLSHLTTLETHIPDVNLFPKDLLFGNLVRYKVFIGMNVSQMISYSYSKTLILTLHQGLSLHDGIYKLLKSAQHLILDYSIENDLEDLNSIVHDLRKGFKHLRCLEVYGYTGVESLIDTKIFPVLENLKVVSAADLRMICYDNLPDQSFCELRELMLSILPELTCLWVDPMGNVDFPSLEELTLRELHSVNDIWGHRFSTANFHSLRILIIFGCDNLVLVFPSYVQKMLQSLEILSIEWCDSVEEVCELNKHDIHNENDTSLATLPCVRDLILGKLPLLKHLWWNMNINAALSNFNN
ncbi:putative disease resistance protein At4g27220 [Bidens hawaiensis]|uniref:putative disease resistance protein At4g27220 n=1 Tax=Bidens hawaiensis TaxID=980011 RepID=UPI00404B5990